MRAFDPCATNPAATAQFLITDTPAPCRTSTRTTTGAGPNRLSGTEITPVDGFGFPYAQGTPDGIQADSSNATTYRTGQIAFVRNFYSTLLGYKLGIINLIDADGRNETVLVSIPNVTIGQLDWSPDGHTIVFSVSFENGTSSHKDLWLADANRPGVATPLLVAPANQTNYVFPSWSYDGKYIVFQALNQTPGISFDRIMYLRMDIPSATPQLLLNEGGSWFSWSPDGTGIVYQTVSGVSAFPAIAILTVSKQADGSLSATKTDLLVWTVNDWGLPGEPSWSPDGNHIIFREIRNGDSTRFKIYEKNASGTFVHIQTSPEILGRVTGWKPDGQQVLFSSFSGRLIGTPTPSELRVYSPLLSAGPTQTPPSLPRLTGNEAIWAVWKKAWSSIGVYNPSTGQVSIRNGLSSGKPDLTFTYGPANAYPVFGDWNGDGADTVGVYETSTGRFLLRNTNSTGFADIAFIFGNPGDVPLAGRWTDTSVIDGVGVFRGNGVLYLRNALSTGYSDFYMVFGNPGDRPIAGDWEGNGVESVGIFRASTQRFYLTNVNGNGITYSDLDFVYGGASATDIPLAGDWVSLGQSRVGIYSGGSFNLLEVPNGTSLPIGTLSTPTPTATPPSRYRASIADTGADAGPGNVIPFVVRIGPTYTPIPTISACPWGGTYSNNTCTYNYSPQRAVDYALKWSQNANPLFCRYNYPGSAAYTCQISTSEPATDCTNFTSQILLAGGLTMTTSYSRVNGASLTVPEEQRFWWALYKTTGVYERGNPGVSWSGAYADQSPNYLKSIGGTALPAITSRNYPGVLQATYTAIPPFQVTQRSLIATEMASLGEAVTAGDLLYLDYTLSMAVTQQPNKRPHMALVIGWGEYVSKWSEIVPVLPATSVPIYQSYTLAKNAGVQNPVPYIVDHGPGGEKGFTFAYARPYYSLWWETVDGLTSSRLDRAVDFRFLHVPAFVVLQVNPNGTATPQFRPTAPSLNLTQLYLGTSATPTLTPLP
jgi:hypothetical protein